MPQRFRSAFAAPTGFVAAVTRFKPRVISSASVSYLPAPRVGTAVPTHAESSQPTCAQAA